MSLFSASIFSWEINFLGKSSKHCGESVSKNLRNFICYHQGEFIQYAFLAGEYHKAMKTAFFQDKKDKKKIKKKHDELLEYLNEKLGYIVSRSFEMMQFLFELRHVRVPRICIKVNFDPTKEIVTALFRDQKVAYVSDCTINENKGFQYIKENGRYYLCQDIPKEAKKGEYFNPRLIKEAVSNYTPRRRITKYIKGRNKMSIDDNWVNCWAGTKLENGQFIKPHYRSCYKSTLIVPLTLWNNKLDKRFLAKFNIENVSRTIFGYLCFDHIETDYFDHIDVDFGYIFADILSLYFLVRFIFVNQSATYRKVSNYIQLANP